jgi:murein DD-endopeptidase MepM/ murein hydrolase activator NlpD
LSSALGNPLLTVGLAAVLLSVFFVPAIAMVANPLPRVSLPLTAASEQALYRIVVPEEYVEKPVQRPGDAKGLDDVTVRSYSIKAGESISQIAQRLGLRLDTLISFNGIQDARSLRAGTVLRYPNADGISYRVRRGDTLEAIAKSFSAPLEGILDKNGLDTSVISVGQELFIPGAHLSQNEINRVLGNLFLYPVRGRISSYFGVRQDPFTGVKRFHNGIDIVNAVDTPITAAMTGRVESVGYNNNYGRFIILKHLGTGYQTMYAHLDKVLVSRGENVRQGQEIGELGNTGYSTGAHLHFSVFKNNEPVDPLRFLK